MNKYYKIKYMNQTGGTDCKNDFTIFGTSVNEISDTNIIVNLGYCFDIKTEIYPMLIRKDINNPYTRTPLWLNDTEKNNILNHPSFTEEEKFNLRQIFVIKEFTEQQKNIIYQNREIMYSIAKSGIIIGNDNSDGYSVSELELTKLNQLLVNDDINNMKTIINKNDDTTYMYGDTIKKIISTPELSCIHDIGNNILKFYIFNYINYYRGKFNDWFILRNAILSEWEEKQTFSMTFDNPYGYSTGTYVTTGKILTGGASINGHIIWGKSNNIVVANKSCNGTNDKSKTYKYYKCNYSIDPFKCEEVQDDAAPTQWCNGFINLDWLNKGNNGIYNDGNTCYANAYLQCILFTYPLIYHTKLLKLTDSFTKLIDIKFSDTKPISINTIPAVNTLMRCDPLAVRYKQQDSQEYLNKFIDKMLENDSYQIKNDILKHDFLKRFKITSTTSTSTPIIDILDDPNKIYSEDISLFQYYFSYVSTNTTNITPIIDPNTVYLKNIKLSYDTSLLLSIFNEKTGHNLTDINACLDHYFNQEELNVSYNDKDNKHIKEADIINYKIATRQLGILNLPNILIIILKRHGTGTKLEHEVTIDYKLNLNKYLYKKDSELTTDYDLYAYVYHNGSTPASGHYISYINKPKFAEATYNNTFKPGWYNANDDDFIKVSKGEHLNDSYFYFYKKRDYNTPPYHHIGNEDIRFDYE